MSPKPVKFLWSLLNSIECHPIHLNHIEVTLIEFYKIKKLFERFQPLIETSLKAKLEQN